MRSVMKQALSAGTTLNVAHDLVYQATLATLSRVKKKVQVPPRTGNPPDIFDYHKLEAARYPQYSKKLDPEKPPARPYGCKLNCETCFTQIFPARIGVTDATALTRITDLIPGSTTTCTISARIYSRMSTTSSPD